MWAGSHQFSELWETEICPSGCPPKSCNIGLMFNSCPPQGEAGSWVFSPDASQWTSEQVYVSPNLCPCSQQLPAWRPFLSAWRFGRDRNQFLRQLPERSACWTYVLVLCFLSHGKAKTWEVFFPNHTALNLGERLWQVGAVNFPTGINVACFLLM